MMARKTSVNLRLGGAMCFVLALLTVAAPAVAQPDAVRTARIRESNARDGWQRVPEILVALNAVPGAHVADVGAGDGFFTVRLARAVGPTGRVTAVDISRQALDRLRARVSDDQLSNVDVVQGEVSDPHLPSASLDGVLIVNAYHEMEEFGRMLDHLRQALKPGGRLVLVEPLDPRLRGESRARQTRAHSLEAGYADREFRAAGFDVIGLRDPFIRGGQREQWLMVAERGVDDQARVDVPAAAANPVPDSPTSVGTDAELAQPELRVSLAQTKALLKKGDVVVLDVRDADSYVAGHVPGALLVPLADLGDLLSGLHLESKPVVTYCT
jgi:SAM-dependent methyltransferase